MANNRMYVRCKICGAEQLICKYYPSTLWYVFNEIIKGKTLEQRMNIFFENHYHNAFYDDDGPTHFELSFEIAEPDDWRGDKCTEKTS